MDAKEKRLLEKKRKAERAELEKKLQYLNTKFQASFFNPDKHLTFEGLLKVTYVRDFVNNTKSILCNSKTTCEKLIPQLVSKFVITDHKRSYSLYEAQINGDEKLLSDTECPLAHTVTWGDDYDKYFILLKLNPQKMLLQDAPDEYEEDLQSREIDHLNDYGYQAYTVQLTLEMDPLKRISDKAIAIAEEIIKNSNDIDQLLRVSTSLVLNWGKLIKEMTLFYQMKSKSMKGVLLKLAENFVSSLVKILTRLFEGFKEMKTIASRTSTDKFISEVYALKAYCQLSRALLENIIVTDFTIRSTQFIIEKRPSENIYKGSSELCPLLMNYISRASVQAISDIIKADKKDFMEAINMFIKKFRILTEILNSCAEYVLLSIDANLKQDERTIERALQDCKLAVARANGVWPPAGYMEALIISIQNVLLFTSSFILHAKRSKVLRNVTFDASKVLEENFMGDSFIEDPLIEVKIHEPEQTPLRLPLLKQASERNELKQAYNINLSVQKTLISLCEEMKKRSVVISDQLQRNISSNEVKQFPPSTENSLKDQIQLLVNELCDIAASVKREVTTIELIVVDETVKFQLFETIKPIRKNINAVNFACLITTGFWPPPDSEKKLLLEITTLLNNILAIEAAFTTCLETQKHYYMDCLAWEEEHQRRLSQHIVHKAEELQGACLSNEEFQSLISQQKAVDLQYETPDEQGQLKVKSGTLNNLVKYLTTCDVIDNEHVSFTRVFFLTFHSFTTSQELLNLLILRHAFSADFTFNKEQQESWHTSVVLPTRIRILAALKVWIEESFYDFFTDQVLVSKFFDFCELLKKDIPTATNNLTNTMKEYLTYGLSKKRDTGSRISPKPLLPKNISDKLLIIDYDPLEIARQLTLIESSLYHKLKASEFFGLSWNVKERQHLARNIMQMIDRANTISLWVATQIVTQEKITQRIKYLTHFIGIAEKCGELNNFNALFSIIAAGLSAGCVTRLKKTWAGLPPRSKETHKSLVELVTNDGNYKNYRAKLSTVVEEPCIPFLGIYLTDLTFIEEGNLDFVKGTNPPHINFTKRRIYANTISQILCYQKHDYSFHYVLPLGKLIDQIELPYNENDLFELSVLNEPKDL